MSHITGLALLTALIAVPVAAQSTPASREAVEAIQSQPLGQALDSWARQTGLQVIYGADLIAGRQSRGARAGASPKEALEQIVEGSGLVITWLNDRTASIGAPAAAAQNAQTMRLATADVEPEASAEREHLEEVTVTGTRQELYSSRVVTSGVLGDKDPFDTPFSIASYSSELAKLQGAYTPNEILKNDPSVQNPGLDIYPNNVIVRGFRAAAGGTRRDGLYGSPVGDAPIEAFDRIEVVKGVAGFLYGFAEPGGVQNYVTKRPTRDAFASVDVQARSGDGQYAHIDTGGPIAGDRFGYRINLAREDQGDFTHRSDILRNVGAVSLDAKLTDALLLRIEGIYQEREQAGQFGLPRTTDGFEPPKYDAGKSIVPPWGRAKFESGGVGVRAEYSLSDDWQVIAQARHDGVRGQLGYGIVSSLSSDGSFSQFSIRPADRIENSSTISQFMLLGKVETGFLRHELAFGAFSRRGTHDFKFSNTRSVAEVSGNLFDLSYPDVPDVPESGHFVFRHERASETHLFVGDTVSIGERWQVMAGVRRVDVDLGTELRVAGTATRYEAKKNSPSAAVIFKPNDSWRLYSSYARSLQQGFSSPCGAGVNIVNPCEIQPPIEAEQLEIGAKARVNGTLDLGVALYQIDLPSDYLNPVTLVYGRFGKQANRGVELTATGNILPNLAVVAGLGYLDAERKRNVNPNLNGRQVQGISDWTGNVFVNYGVKALPGFSITTGVYYTGSREFDALNTIPVSGYTRVDLGAQYRTKMFRMPLKLRANVHNVTDKFYWESVWNGAYSAGNDRTYSVSAELQLY